LFNSVNNLKITFKEFMIKMDKYLKLMTPGPTNVPEIVRRATAKPILHHRTPEFTKIFEDFTENLKYVFKTKNDVITLTSSGTGGMEASVCNFFSSGDKVIVCNNGKFGERFVEICKKYGLEVVEIKYEYGEATNPDDVKEKLDENVKGVFVTQSETSTGICNDIATISKIVHENSEALLIVDSISSLGANDIRTDEWGLDVVITGSQKALMGPPGLCFISVSSKAWEFYKPENPKYYFDLKNYKEKFPQTPYTPAISMIVGMNESLKMIRNIGIDAFIKRHKIFADKLRKGIVELGLELFPKSGLNNNGLVVVKSPEGVDSKNIIDELKKYGYLIANGQGELKGKIFRISTMGDINENDINNVINALKEILR